MTIYLIRHGQTDWNKQNRLQGIEDIPLNETGIRQSQHCAQAFRDIPVDYILTSPLKRARATAEIIADRIKAGPVVVERGLTERDFGKLSGLTFEEREALLARGEDPCMEPKDVLIARFMHVVNTYVHAGASENILLVSHGASINAVLAHLSGGEIGSGKTVLKNTCISKLVIDGRLIDIAFFNLTPDEFCRLQDSNRS